MGAVSRPSSGHTIVFLGNSFGFLVLWISLQTFLEATVDPHTQLKHNYASIITRLQSPFDTDRSCLFWRFFHISPPVPYSLAPTSTEDWRTPYCTFGKPLRKVYCGSQALGNRCCLSRLSLAPQPTPLSTSGICDSPRDLYNKRPLDLLVSHRTFSTTTIQRRAAACLAISNPVPPPPLPPPPPTPCPWRPSSPLQSQYSTPTPPTHKFTFAPRNRNSETASESSLRDLPPTPASPIRGTFDTSGRAYNAFAHAPAEVVDAYMAQSMASVNVNVNVGQSVGGVTVEAKQYYGSQEGNGTWGWRG
ncbi:hypothetical protein DFP72DRAFT_933398 [Ephemerocybe angulata]|uniref:Uncharacterized protein n=1 Tax=Ephemerocybe angulata TaxID=980116 RepID=A0A8H6LV69_9AGAR|nr:hypothetical protein DFP72DRAFT_933398 [Tulosesus angulatus]